MKFKYPAQAIEFEMSHGDEYRRDIRRAITRERRAILRELEEHHDLCTQCLNAAVAVVKARAKKARKR